MRKIINTFTPYGVEILVFAFIVNVLETAYFGWTMEATSRAEEICDVTCAFAYILGFILIIIGTYTNGKNKKNGRIT
tara:strand:+ start:805 stop:1035 length:231 start_codon:yes stop_codon:yes gene_type:complete